MFVLSRFLKRRFYSNKTAFTVLIKKKLKIWLFRISIPNDAKI